MTEQHIGTYWHLHPGMLGRVCERCPAGWVVTKTISVLTQAERQAGCEGDELSSYLAK